MIIMLRKNAIKVKPGRISNDVCKRSLRDGKAKDANTIAIKSEISVMRRVSVKIE